MVTVRAGEAAEVAGQAETTEAGEAAEAVEMRGDEAGDSAKLRNVCGSTSLFIDMSTAAETIHRCIDMDIDRDA